MGFSNGISEPIKRYLGECPECQAQFETSDPTKRSITTTPCPSCEKALCSECPTFRCVKCANDVCGECALETCEGMPEGHICSKCRGDEGKCIDGYSADEYAERQTNILSGVVDQPEPDFGPEAFNRYQDQREGGPWVETPMPLQEWAKELAINHQTLRERLKQWPVHKALTEPLRIASQSRAVKRALGIVPSPEAVYQRRKADERKLRAIGTRVRIPSDPFGSIEESKS